MDQLKTQAHATLTKLLMFSSKQQQSQDNPQGVQKPTVRKFQQYINDYSDKLQPQQKLMIELLLSKKLKEEVTYQQFKLKIKNMKDELQSPPQNQFDEQLIANKSQNQVVKQEKTESNNQSKPNQTKKFQQTKVKTKKISRNLEKERKNMFQLNVQSNPEYFRIDLQLCYKLFQFYCKNQIDYKHKPISFEQKEQYLHSMSYNKIIEIFKDAKIPLQMPQKLSILRAVKKFCFNQKYINKEQFVKIFKCIVHGVGIKQQSFQTLVKMKSYELPQKRVISRQSYRQKKQIERYHKIRTQASVLQPTNMSQISRRVVVKKLQPLYQSQRPRFESIEQRKTKDGRAMSSRKRVMTTTGDQNQDSYLIKAMQRNKVMKITWESLFKITQENRPNYINIPSFIRDGYHEQL